ncbi:MAG: methyltransferase domain-containing protein [Pseudomonadota bacterium]
MKQPVFRKQASSSHSVFLNEWMKSPFGVGAIAPSSTVLANAMVQGIVEPDKPVLELGPGTGVFTAALLHQGLRPEQLAVVELGEIFVRQLSQKYPGVAVIQADASSVKHRSPFGLGSTQAVICGLPLLSIPAPKIFRIVASCFECLRADGQFRLFTYGHRCPVSKPILERLNLQAYRTAVVLENLPPASVYSIKRREETVPNTL